MFTLTEGTPTGLPVNMEMTFEGWTVDGAPATSPVTFTIGDGTTTALVVTNSTREKVGTFEVTKEFDGVDPQDPQLANVVVTITWIAPDGATGIIELTRPAARPAARPTPRATRSPSPSARSSTSKRPTSPAYPRVWIGPPSRGHRPVRTVPPLAG